MEWRVEEGREREGSGRFLLTAEADTEKRGWSVWQMIEEVDVDQVLARYMESNRKSRFFVNSKIIPIVDVKLLRIGVFQPPLCIKLNIQLAYISSISQTI